MNATCKMMLAGIMLLAALLGPFPHALAQPRPPIDEQAIRDMTQRAQDEAQRAVEEAQSAYEQAMEIAESAIEAALEHDDMGSLSFLSREIGGSRDVVKNAPYSAEAVTETTQVLMDGNRIVRKSVTLLARDAAGRTRQERKTEHGSVVYINDPVERKKYVLQPGRKTAVALPQQVGAAPPLPPVPPSPPTPPSPSAAPTPPVPPTDAIQVRPGRIVVRKGDSATGGQDVHIEVVRVGSDGAQPPMQPMQPVPPMPPMPPVTLHGHAMPLPFGMRGNGVTESLGSRDFDGVSAEGTRVTHTIPAGAIGNEKPIAIVAERWYSPQLNLVVMSSASDPRSGVTSYRLVNIKRSEPAAELFRIPADYKVRSRGRNPASKSP